MTQLVEDLRAARALIATPDKWCKEVNSYRERDGTVISRCAIEAVGTATEHKPGAFNAARLALINALPGPFDPEAMVSKYNDRAIQAAESQP